MTFSISQVGDTATITVQGYIVGSNRERLRELTLDAMEHEARHFVVDLASALYIDSAALGTLVALSKQIHEKSGTIRLVHLSRDLRTLFQLTRLATCFDDSDGGPSAA
jgi:anti-anti-sigma factor